MKFLLMVYTDPVLMDSLPQAEFDSLMKGCLHKADELRAAGVLLDSQQLEDPATARSVRTRNGSTAVVDGPFAEAKEVFAGFNLIEAPDIAEAVRIANLFPWSRFGSIEVRPVRDMNMVRERVGA
ncbi:MAG TPA: YciI family protein [Lysobacter sp.]